MPQRNPFAGMGGQWAAIGSAGLDRAIAKAQAQEYTMEATTAAGSVAAAKTAAALCGIGGG